MISSQLIAHFFFLK